MIPTRAAVEGALILAAVAGVLAAVWWVYDSGGDQREAEIERRIAEATAETQAELDRVAEDLATAEAANRALASRLANSRKEIEDAIRSDAGACRIPDGLWRQLDGRWSADPAP